MSEAVRLGFGRPAVLSSDTTVQEPAIGYPHEAGILRGVAQRVCRALKKLQDRGVKAAQAGLEQAKEILQTVKAYHLFAQGKEQKDQLLNQLVQQTQGLIEHSQAVIQRVGQTSSQAMRSAVEKLKEMATVSAVLLPQIRQWLETGKVAKNKLLHAGITAARAIVKQKAGQKVQFGLKWLIHRIEGGYLFGKVVPAYADERQMPLEALHDYRQVVGQTAPPR